MRLSARVIIAKHRDPPHTHTLTHLQRLRFLFPLKAWSSILKITRSPFMPCVFILLLETALWRRHVVLPSLIAHRCTECGGSESNISTYFSKFAHTTRHRIRCDPFRKLCDCVTHTERDGSADCEQASSRIHIRWINDSDLFLLSKCPWICPIESILFYRARCICCHFPNRTNSFAENMIIACRIDDIIFRFCDDKSAWMGENTWWDRR